MSEEVLASSDNDSNDTNQDRKRPLDNSPPSEKKASESSPTGDEDKRPSPAKKKSKQEKKEKRKEKKKFIDDEAEESGEDEEGSEKGEDFEEEEDQDQYEDDGMIVLDGEESEDESEEDGRREKRRRGVEHTRLKRSKHLSVVEDEDLQLLQDNLMQGIEQRERMDKDQQAAAGSSRVSTTSTGEIIPERVRDDDNLFEEDEEEELGSGGDKAGTGVTGGGRHNRYVDEYDSDEMKGFIEDDEDDEEGGAVEDDEAREERRRKRKEQERAHMLGGGPSREQLEEAEALFGEGFEDMLGEDSEDEDDDEEEGEGGGGAGGAAAKESKRLQKLRSRFERSTLVESFCTDHDDELRVADRPERLVDTMAGRVAPDPEERQQEAAWMAGNLARKIHLALQAEAEEFREEQYSRGGGSSSVPHRPELWQLDVANIQHAIKDSVVSVLEFLQLEDKEVPFIWSYRKDYLHTGLLTRDHLWFIQEQDEKWEELVEKKRRLLLDWKLIAEAAVSDPTEESTSATHQSVKALAMQVSSQEILMERRSAALESAQQELESAQDNLEAVRVGGRGSAKTEDGAAAKSWDEDDDEEEEEEAGGGEEAQARRVEQAEARLQRAQEEALGTREEVQAAEEQLQEMRAAQQKQAFRAHTCSRAVARAFLTQFPTDRYEALLSHTNEEAEVNDCQAYYGLLLRGCQAESGEGGDDSTGGAAGKKKKLRKGLLDKDQAYLKARKSPKLREFAQLFNVAACELGDALRSGPAMRMEPPAPPDSLQHDLEEVAAQHVSDDFPSAADVLEGARCLLATEIAYEPSVRSSARNMFLQTATLSTCPTPAGYEAINPFHELFGVHLLADKPLRHLLDATGPERHLFARLMLAQKEGLLVVSLHTPTLKQQPGERDLLDLNLFLHEMGLLLHFLPAQPHPWDSERLLVLGEVLERHLLPQLHTEFKRELMRLSKEAIIQESAQQFQRMLSVGPYRPSHVTAFDVLKSCPVRPTYCSVASIFLPTEGRDAIFFAFVDRDGLVRAHDLLPGKMSKQKKQKIRDFLKASLPDVVVINTGAGQVAKSTKDMVEKYLVAEVQDQVAAERAAAREERRGRNRYSAYDDDFDDDDDDEDDAVFSPDVLLVQDDVARIFGSSTRAKKMFPEILPGGAAAICLARFVQDPLAEYANMWTSADSIGFFGHEVFFLDIHPLKHLVQRAKVPLLRALERCLVNVVCDVGVDINMAVSHDHLAGPLAFVAGMGLRKADALRSNIKNVLGFVSSRRELFERKLMGRVVYTNAAGYLRVCDNGLGELQLDPLDDTRVHPECYVQHDFAPKICASALVIDHSAEVYIKTVLLLREHCRRELDKNLESNPAFKQAWLTRGELLELPDKMEQLELDAYAEEVEASGEGKRFRQFEDIKEELRYPWLDRRVPLADCPDEYDMFSLLTGETDQTLYVGMRVPCSVLELKSRSADIMTGAGIRGFVRLQNCADEHIEDVSEVLQRGSSLVGVVIGVMKAQLRVEISLRKSDVSRDEAYWFANRNTHPAMKEWWNECRLAPQAKLSCSSMMYVRIDPYFLEEKALHQYTATYEAKLRLIDSMQQAATPGGGGEGGKKKRAGNNHRAVFHPLFHNKNSKQAERFLSTDSSTHPGDVVIRPSSSDKDSLVVTWMYLPGKFKHIEVQERGKLQDQGGIGQQLAIRGEQEDFSDLDEVFARYIQPMNDLVTQLVAYRCYKEFRPPREEEEQEQEELGPAVLRMSLEAWLNQEITATPNRIPYCICLHEKGVPGYFQLSWLRNAGHKVHTEYIAIKPEGYRLQEKFFATPSELIHWFKQHASKTQSAPSSSRRPSRFSSVGPGGEQSSNGNGNGGGGAEEFDPPPAPPSQYFQPPPPPPPAASY